jgi:hypothetical protein
MTHTQQQSPAVSQHYVAVSAPSRTLAEAMAAHFDGREQNVPYGVIWDGAGLEADTRLRQPLSHHHAPTGG